MSDALKLSTALPGDKEINGLDHLAEALVAKPGDMVCAVLILDVKDIRYVPDAEAHIPTLRFRRGEAWLVGDTPEAVRMAMVARSEERTGRTPLPFGEVESKKEGRDRPTPDDCDHVDFHVERDHLEDVPDGMFRATCHRCGWIEYHPVSELEDYLTRGANEPTDDELGEGDEFEYGDEPESESR